MDTVTPSTAPLQPSMKSRTAWYDPGPNLLRVTSRYSSASLALRLIETESTRPFSSGTMSLPLIRLPSPLVSKRTLLRRSVRMKAAISFRSSNLSVGSPYPQNTISLTEERSSASNASLTSCTVGSLSSHRESASPRVGVWSLIQNVHLHGHLLVMLM